MFFIVLVVLITIDHETCLSVFYATIIYFIIYFRTSKSKFTYKFKKCLIKIIEKKEILSKEQS